MTGKRIAWSAVVWIATSVTASFGADDYSLVSYQINGIGSGGGTNTDMYSHQNYGATPLSLAYTGSVKGVGHSPASVFSGTSISSIQVSAYAGPGILKVDAGGIATATSSTVSADGQDQVSTSLAGDTTAIFSDMITINSRYQGVSMTVKGSYTVAGSIVAEASSDPYPEHLASSSINVLLGGTGIAASASVVGSAGAVTQQTPVDVNQDLVEVVPVSFTVMAGTPTKLLSQLMMDSSTTADISGGLVRDPSSGANLPAPVGSIETSYSADYSHTVLWGGISSVTFTQDDTPVPDWSVSSESGFNYANPAVDETPEPASAVLLLSGVIVACARRRRSDRDCRPS